MKINNLPNSGAMEIQPWNVLSRSYIPADITYDGTNYKTSKVSLASIANMGQRWHNDNPSTSYVYYRNTFYDSQRDITELDYMIDALKQSDEDDIMSELEIGYVGNYFEIDNRKWRIVDINYFMNYEELELTPQEVGNSTPITGTKRPHYVIMPDEPTTIQPMNNTVSTTMGLAGMTWTTSTHASDLAIINNVFGDHIIPFGNWLSNSVDSNGNTTSKALKVTYLGIPSEGQLFGTNRISGRTTNNPLVTTNDNCLNQFSLFRLAPQFIPSSEIYYISNIATTTALALVRTDSILSYANPNKTVIGIRPFFLIG